MEIPGKDEVERITTWTADQLSWEQRDFLASFSEQAELDIQGLGSTLFCHGSPRGDDEIITVATPESRMVPMLATVAQDIVICGHTHVQFDRTIGGKRVINAGSVGRPYEGQPGAYWAMLGPDVALRRTPYDFERAADQMRASGYPGAEEFVRENVLASPSAAETTGIFERMAAQRDAQS
jgi:diadenosine tetraphosphatase ApaH/serine/threonine PP2A family protein phosphatase